MPSQKNSLLRSQASTRTIIGSAMPKVWRDAFPQWLQTKRNRQTLRKGRRPSSRTTGSMGFGLRITDISLHLNVPSGMNTDTSGYHARPAPWISMRSWCYPTPRNPFPIVSVDAGTYQKNWTLHKPETCLFGFSELKILFQIADSWVYHFAEQT